MSERRLVTLLLALATGGCAPAAPAEGAAPTQVRSSPAVSSRGRWLAYTGSTKTGERVSAAVLVTAGNVSSPRSLPFTRGLTWSENGRWLSGCTAEKELALVRVRGAELGEPIRVGACGKLVWAPGAARLAVISGEGTALIDVSGQPARSPVPVPKVASLAWSPSGAHVLLSPPGAGEGLVVESSTMRSTALKARPGRELTWCRWAKQMDQLACAESSKDGFGLVTYRYDNGSWTALAQDVPSTNSVQWLDFAHEHVLFKQTHDDRVQIWRPGESSIGALFDLPNGNDLFRLTSDGRSLVDLASGVVRWWSFDGGVSSKTAPSPRAKLVNVRVSTDERKALVGVAHPQQPGRQTDVWLVRELDGNVSGVRLLEIAPGNWSVAHFSAGSGWVIATVAPDTVPPLAAVEGAPARVSVAETTGVHLESGKRAALGRSDWLFSADDAAMAAWALDGLGLLVHHLEGERISSAPARVDGIASGGELAWQPVF